MPDIFSTLDLKAIVAMPADDDDNDDDHNNNHHHDHYGHDHEDHLPGGVVGYVLNTTILVVGLYVFISLLVYACNKPVQRQTQNRSGHHIQKKTETALLAGSITGLCRFLLEFVELVYGHSDPIVCSIIHSVKIFLILIATTCIYMVLWLRQQKMNDMIRMREPYKTIMRCLSWFSLSLILMTVVIAILFAVSAATLFNSNSAECNHGWKLFGQTEAFTVALYFIYTLVCQISLLILIVVPLLKRRHSLNRTNSAAQNTDSGLTLLLQRLTACTLLSIVSDGIIGLTCVHLNGNYTICKQILYNVDFLVLLFCVIMSFRDWRLRLGACCLLRHKPAPHTTASGKMRWDDMGRVIGTCTAVSNGEIGPVRGANTVSSRVCEPISRSSSTSVKSEIMEMNLTTPVVT